MDGVEEVDWYKIFCCYEKRDLYVHNLFVACNCLRDDNLEKQGKSNLEDGQGFVGIILVYVQQTIVKEQWTDRH